MTKPATEEEIEAWGLDAVEPYPTHQDSRILSLIARIRSEQEAHNGAGAEFNAQWRAALDRAEAAEALASSIREKTIRECAAQTCISEKLTRFRILALLEQKP